MSSANVSSFHSSSECPTAHVSRRNLESDDLDSNLYSATSTRPKASAMSNTTGMTPLDSDAFASPMTRPPTGVSTSFTQSPTTARGAQRLGSMRPPGISIISPASPSHSSNSAAASSVGATLPPHQKLPSNSHSPKAVQANPAGAMPTTSANSNGNASSNNQHPSTTSTGQPGQPSHPRHHRPGLLSLLHIAAAPAADPATENATAPLPAATGTPAGTPHAATQRFTVTSPDAAAAAGAATAVTASNTGSGGGTTAAPATPAATLPAVNASAGAASTPARRAVSSPMVPTTRGSAGGWMRRHPTTEEFGAGGAKASADAPARAVPRLPPLRPPSSYFTTGSKSGSSHASRRNGSSRAASPTSQVEGGAGAATTAHPQPLAAVKVHDPADGADSGWWAAARRYAASKGDQVNAYLERLVNPGAVNLATANAQTAAAQARSRRASQAFQAAPGSARNRTTSSLVSGGGGRHSRTASASSGFDGVFDADRRTPPPRPPTTPAHSDHRTLYEPFSSVPRQDTGAASDAMPLDVVMIDPEQEPYVWNDPMARAPEVWVEQHAANDSFNVGDVSGSDEDGMGAEPNTYVVDLLSALRGYLTNPTEPFGHLVAAALASRSPEMPVRGFEVAAAEHNPFLVRMIVDSGNLEVQDEEAQRNVQDTVDELIPATEGELSPGIYEYLSSFFKMPFVRLSHGQYALLKRSGFEYIKLMFDHQHVLPDEPFHSILINESHVMHVFNIVFMIVQLLSIVFCTVTIALVLASWMKMDNNALQSYGFYTLIVFGGGWALYLIFIIYAVRSRQDERRYEPQVSETDRLLVPSPYVAVVPVVPLFDIFCVVKYVMAVKKKHMILGHNIVASSRLSGAFYAVWFAFPQLITQSYFNNIQLSIEERYRHRWAYIMLMVGAVCQWGIALIGYIGFLFTHDSIDGFGFACFNMGRVPHMLERHNAAAHTLHYLTAFLMETNVYLIASTTINRPILQGCDTFWNVILALSAFSVFYMLIVFCVITLTDYTAVRVSFTCVMLLAVQVTLCVCSERLERTECAVYRHYFFRGTFVFGYLSWGAYFTMFIVWLLMMVQWVILCHHKLNLFPRVLWPYARRDERFAKPKKAEKAATEGDVSSHAADDSKGDAQTV